MGDARPRADRDVTGNNPSTAVRRSPFAAGEVDVCRRQKDGRSFKAVRLFLNTLCYFLNSLSQTLRVCQLPHGGSLRTISPIAKTSSPQRNPQGFS